ncbi:lytic murein transglycosylase [Achromobacter spanius]|uniref:lytic murein transglycosylase n=1 Tax=Achromobacter spanius TaxID=217203 RepID=UPI0036E97F5D
MRQRSSRPRIDSLSRVVLAACITAAAAGAAQAQSPASATGSRAQTTPAPAQPQPALTPKRSFDDVVAAQEAAKTAAPAATPAAAAPAPATTPSTGSATPATTPAATAAPAAPAAAAAAAPTVIIPTELDTKACIAKLRNGATANGLTVADWDKYTANAKLLPTTVASAKGQPEGRESWWDYIAKTVDDERVNDGLAVMKKVGPQLSAIGQQYQVDPATLVAIFGIETNYGRQIGKTDVLNAWLTRACTENKTLWEKNAYASVRLLRDGTVPADSFVGSWSGAFGMTQFIPTSFYELAADGDGDGRIDLYHSLPDALASTANHLRKRRAKWTHGLPAVVEVRVPADVAAAIPPEPDAEYVGSQDRRTIAQWAQAGLKLGDGSVLKLPSGNDEKAYLFAPTGAKGPVFLATVNFDAILHYNQSRRYGLAVSLLLNRLQGRPGIITAWPTDDPGLSRAEIKELQEALYGRGYDVGEADGIPGAKTRDAVRAEQERRGLPQDGRVGKRILDALKADKPDALRARPSQ